MKNATRTYTYRVFESVFPIGDEYDDTRRMTTDFKRNDLLEGKESAKKLFNERIEQLKLQQGITCDGKFLPFATHENAHTISDEEKSDYYVSLCLVEEPSDGFLSVHELMTSDGNELSEENELEASILLEHLEARLRQ